FVIGAFVAVGPDIELEAFQLHAFPVRDVVQIQDREIRLAGHRAQAGELRNFHMNQEIALGRGVRKMLQFGAGLRGHFAYLWLRQLRKRMVLYGPPSNRLMDKRGRGSASVTGASVYARGERRAPCARSRKTARTAREDSYPARATVPIPTCV